ncbi:DUF4326 domain-containing protein [Haloarcula marismortui]|uniref:DUF4326 domain-containing protein n=1 Tax=Haloarcula marismortui TaxID=2238 RepID=UPI0012690242|nr:DUF4326 domain-containing protein [Haloarcula californiae]
MSLSDYGARSWASLRALERDEHGDVCCPVCQSPIGHSRGELEIPVARLEDDELQDELQEAGVEYLRGRGYESHCHEILVPETVGGPRAMGYSSRMIGVRADLGQDGTDWIPVHSEDMEAADNALALANSSGAAADGSGRSADESTDAANCGDSRLSVDVERPDVVEELGLPTEYADGHPRWTYVGHVMQDDTTVNAGRSGPDGQLNLITADVEEAGWLGNPYVTEEAGGDYSREESVAAFTHSFLELLEGDPELRSAVGQLRGEVLGCWCHTLEEHEDGDLCHADVIARVVDRALVRSGGVQE